MNVTHFSENIMVDVVVAVYNHQPYIQQALESILMQDVDFEFRIIVHDDASTDDSKKIIEEYVQRHPDKFVFISQKENQYSKGISISTFYIPQLRAKYVAFCEGDDYWTDPLKLKKQVDFLENNPQYIASTHNIRVIDDKDVQLSDGAHVYPMFDTYVFTLRDMEKGRLPGQTASLVHHNFWLYEKEETKTAFMKCQANGDIKMMTLLAVKGDIYCMKETMADHRKITENGDSWSARTKNRNMRYFHYRSLVNINEFLFQSYGITINNEQRLRSIIKSSFTTLIKQPSRDNYDNIKAIYSINKVETLYSVVDLAGSVLTYPYKKVREIIKEKHG